MVNEISLITKAAVIIAGVSVEKRRYRDMLGFATSRSRDRRMPDAEFGAAEFAPAFEVSQSLGATHGIEFAAGRFAPLARFGVARGGERGLTEETFGV